MNEILIMDIIGQDMFGAGVIAKDIKSQLDAMGDVDEITVRINSPGGDVFEGLAIHNLLKQHPAKVTVKVDGYAASIASIIAIAADDVQMAENSMLMAHMPYTFAIGDAAEMRKQAEVLDKVTDVLVQTYQSKSGMDSEKIIALMEAETWFSAKEAKAAGLADTIIKGGSKLSNVSAYRWINKAPEVCEPELTPAPTEAEIDLLARSNELAKLRADITRQRKALR